MKTYIYKSFLLTFLLGIIACQDGKEFFEVERYEKYIYVVSDNDQIFHAEYLLEGNETATRPLSFGVSGTNPIDQDVYIQVEKDTVLFDKYNFSNFVEDSAQYAWQIPDANYQLESDEVTIQAGKDVNYEIGLLNIQIKESLINEMSPDSVYFIPLAIKDASPYPLNEDKMNVLFRIYKKNKYATQKDRTYYTASGYTINEYSEAYYSTSKLVFPLTYNKVRTYIHSEAFDSSDDEEKINSLSMVLIINEDNTISYSSYKEGGVEIWPLSSSDDPKELSYYYNNTYDEKNEEFWLHYGYINRSGQEVKVMECLSRDKFGSN